MTLPVIVHVRKAFLDLHVYMCVSAYGQCTYISILANRYRYWPAVSIFIVRHCEVTFTVPQFGEMNFLVLESVYRPGSFLQFAPRFTILSRNYGKTIAQCVKCSTKSNESVNKNKVRNFDNMDLSDHNGIARETSTTRCRKLSVVGRNMCGFVCTSSILIDSEYENFMSICVCRHKWGYLFKQSFGNWYTPCATSGSSN